MRATVGLLDAPAPGVAAFEIAERKGIGHPDTICDAVAEAASRALCRHYLERFGLVLHHNLDKALLVGGAARAAFGGGEVLEPIRLFIAGRATRVARGARVPVDEIAVEAARDWLRGSLRALDPDRHVRIEPLIRSSSPALVALFERQRATGAALANDTSFGVGFAPLDALERAVLAVERRLNAPAARDERPWLGEDVKVMGARHGATLRLTVACALVGRHVADLADYFAKKAQVRALAQAAAREAAGTAAVEVEVNAADGPDAESVYLTVTGTSAEAGDDGQVGRGNRANGLITPYRPMSLEAVAGKNPVTHVGKLYNVAAHRVAAAVVAAVPAVTEAYCWLLSGIGRPIDSPQLFEVRVRVADAGALEALRPRIGEAAAEAAGRVTTLWREALAGTLPVY